MAQEYIKIRKSPSDEWLMLPQPDSGALSYDFETTYTEDSGVLLKDQMSDFARAGRGRRKPTVHGGSAWV